MTNQEFENKCKTFFNTNYCMMNKKYNIIFVYDVENLIYSYDVKLINAIDNKYNNWYGHCHQENQTIYLNMRNNKSNDFMFEVFIHEMAHSMQFKLSHNKEFKKNVIKLGGILTESGK